jgi:hypothetical protein
VRPARLQVGFAAFVTIEGGQIDTIKIDGGRFFHSPFFGFSTFHVASYRNKSMEFSSKPG